MSNDPPITTSPADPSPYIRTYAKDVAAVSAKNGTTLATPSAPVQKPKRTKSFLHPDESLLTSSPSSPSLPDLSQLQAAAEQMPLESVETEQEVEARIREAGNHDPSGVLQSISLPRIAIGDIVPNASFQNPIYGEALSIPPALPATPLPSISFTQNPLTVAEAESERVAILERLKNKIESHREEETQSSENLPAIVPPEPLPAVVPEAVIPPPLPPAPEIPQIPIPPAVPPPPPIPLPPSPGMIHDELPSPFHSYSSDFADRIDEQHASTFSVLAAEDTARPVAAPAPIKKRTLVPILLGIFLILIGIGAVYAAYIFMSAKGPISILPSIPSVIVTDQQVELKGTGVILMQALAHQAAQSLPSNNVALTYIAVSTTTKQGIVESPTSGGGLITALDFPAPNILLRNIDPSSTVGIVHAGSETRTFFILKVISYERTFAGMLDWEPTIANDLSLLYPAYPSVSVISTSTSASSSPIFLPPPASAGQFVDEIVDNHDARVLRDTAGNSLIIYGYADKQTLIIARDEAAFTLLVGRLQASQS
ncbi:hypothetical protein H0X32_03745 [Patescibacteria group bacterium]|nr:hypothetical protein [Patescibacteria group bacterium]